MFTKHDRRLARQRRHRRVRRRVWGTATRPRLAVYRSLRHISVQLVDDERGHTMVTASTYEAALRGRAPNTATAAEVGRLLAERAVQLGVRQVVFDRGGYLYHGRVEALAEAARAAGLEF